MHVARQKKLRVLEELERRAKTFRTDEDLHPLRVPREPLLLADVIAHALRDLDGRFDPLLLRQRTLLHLEWEDGSKWELWVAVLPSGLKLFCDAGEEDAHVLASGGRYASGDTDRQFLELLSESAGGRFGLEMAGGAPAGVRTSLTDREFLTDVFVHLFEVSGTEDSVRQTLHEHGVTPDESDFRSDVAAWLPHVLR